MPIASEAATASSQHKISAPVETEVQGGDFETLFQMLAELGPAPKEFMLGLSDPVLETENVFELEANL